MSIGDFPVLCASLGLILFTIGFYLAYILFIKIDPWEQQQFYLKDSSKKYYIEYLATVINLGDYKILRFALPRNQNNLKLGADLEKIKLL